MKRALYILEVSTTPPLQTTKVWNCNRCSHESSCGAIGTGRHHVARYYFSHQSDPIMDRIVETMGGGHISRKYPDVGKVVG